MLIFRAVLAAVAVATLSTKAPADVITLKSGERIEGKILEVSRTEVKIETKVHNVRTTATYRRALVADIEYRPLPEDFWGPERNAPAKADRPDAGQAEEERDSAEDDIEEDEADAATPGARPRRQRVDPASQFVVVPVVGGIGTEVTADGLRAALQQTRGRGVGHVVFTVDSPGGYVYEAVQILQVLAEFDDELVYHCVIEKGAISAASVFAAAADRIYVRPTARLGGAVAYSSSQSTGAAEVDAKFNSIWSAEVASRAESKGHPGDVFRAMIVMPAELWQNDADGSFSPRSRGGDTRIDGPDTILTITASQMTRGRMATAFSGPLDAMGELTGVQGWTELKNIGQRAMDKAARERADLQRRYDRALEAFERGLEDFQRDHPSQGSYTAVRDRRGLASLDSKSMREWQTRTDASVRACDVMLGALKELAAVNSRADRTGAKHLVIPEKLGHARYLEIEKARDTLVRERNDPPVARMIAP